MSKLDHVDPAALREKLADTGDAKATKRLMVALDYLDGVAVDELSDRYGIPRSTVYYWLSRFDERPIDEAITDEDRPGRPTALDRSVLEDVVAAGPREYDVDAEEWSPATLRDVLDREFDVSYSEGHVRRLLKELTD
ncbi:helix-turn-helix domain-containing protein [Salinigranum halophilum]|jgi:transposase|uniref:helix-turn-helix domain-containing protein n=1 Tax=Salinigranum halophilum TaxID=2565931 RepID=UPI0010A8CE7B|nr:helix-turn-helix domain-containing protein [Salinigranum halophilum]